MNHINVFYTNYCVLSSKNDKPQKDMLILYNYKCLVKDYSDILVATRLMLLNDYKIINPTLNKIKRINKEWIFFSTQPLTSIKRLWKDESKINYMIDRIKFINDLDIKNN